MKKTIITILSTFTLMLTAGMSAASFSTQEVSATTVLTTRSSDQYIANYYSSISQSQTGTALASSLESLLKSERNNSFSYNSLQTSAFQYTDVDPLRPNGGYIVSFYSGTPVNGYSGMNKEHTWPDSHGGGKIDNDPHVIRPTLTSENSARGNQYFAAPPNAGWDPASFDNPKYRGIAARIIFYGATIGKSAGLILEDVGRGQASGTGNRMGKLGDLLIWNLQYPVDQSEIIRNETLDISLNYNRNPFIDDPSYACRIWGGTNANTQSICAASAIAPTAISVSPSSTSVNIDSTVNLSVNVTPSNANSSVTWSSNNTSVATVSNGVVTPVNVGQAIITARSTVNTNIYNTATITVTNDPVPVTSISLNKQSANIVLGNSMSLTASVLPNNASNKNITWSTTNSSVASVTQQGLVSANNIGSATIIAETLDGGYKAQAVISVTQEPETTSIRGLFHNDNNTNSGGEGGVNATNMNHGLATSNALGFGGTEVISSLVSATQGYFPRSGGLALGSSSNSGSLTINLNNSYHALKVEAYFNNAGKGNTVSSITGSTAVISSINGTAGTAYSNPTDATPYVVEFVEPTSSITITTSARVALVELVVYYGSESTSLSDAFAWADAFLANTDSACLNQTKAAFEAVWPSLTNSYNALSEDAKIIITGSVAYDQGNAIEESLARYRQIVSKYQMSNFLSISGLSSTNNSIYANNNSGFVILIVIVNVIAISTLVFFIKKGRRNKYYN